MHIEAGKLNIKPRQGCHRRPDFPYYSLTAQRQGSFSVRSKNGPEFIHDQPTFYLTEPNTPYISLCIEPIKEEVWVSFTPPSNMLPLLKWPLEEPGRRFLRVTNKMLWAKMYQSLEFAVTHMTSCETGCEALAMNALERTLLLAQPLVQNYAHGTPQDPRISQVMALIRENPAKQWTMQALTKAANMSATNLTHRFSETVGMSPVRYADIQRIEYAKSLLLRTSNSIGSISDRLGYANPYHFSNRFQKITGLRPLAFRKNPTKNSENKFIVRVRSYNAG
ncbi:MAG: AraC family transcriptional regulator [Chthoniobacterales bacterium]